MVVFCLVVEIGTGCARPLVCLCVSAHVLALGTCGLRGALSLAVRIPRQVLIAWAPGTSSHGMDGVNAHVLTGIAVWLLAAGNAAMGRHTLVGILAAFSAKSLGSGAIFGDSFSCRASRLGFAFKYLVHFSVLVRIVFTVRTRSYCNWRVSGGFFARVARCLGFALDDLMVGSVLVRVATASIARSLFTACVRRDVLSLAAGWLNKAGQRAVAIFSHVHVFTARAA